mgnify:CR=1 FL=1|nr:hypothetical protein [uncultured Dongia sp.]
MGRGAVAVVTGLCTAPLFGVLAFWIADLAIGPGSGPDGSIANAYLVLLIAIVAGLFGGIVTALIAMFWLPPRLRPHALVGNAVLVFAMIVGWQVFIADPSPLEYDGARPSLEAEIRVPKAIGGAAAVSTIVLIDDLSNTRHDDQIRAEGDFEILPWETTPYRVKEWAIQIIVQNHDLWTRFDLDLPTRPTESTDWSPWLIPSQKEGYEVPKDVTLRYRFRLIPYGQ